MTEISSYEGCLEWAYSGLYPSCQPHICPSALILWLPVWCQLPPATCHVAAGPLDAAEVVRLRPRDGDEKESQARPSGS
jgi:hypothetical protein